MRLSGQHLKLLQKTRLYLVKQKFIAFLLVFLGGFAVMILEIVGVRFLA